MTGSPWPTWRGSSNRHGSSPYAPSKDFFPTSGATWRFRIGVSTQDAFVYASPVIDNNGTVYVGNSKGQVYGVTAAGAKKWDMSLSGYILSTMAIGSNGFLYVGVSGNVTAGVVYALDHNDGVIQWVRPVDGEIPSSPVLYGEMLYIATKQGTLYALHADTGKVQWSFKPQPGSAIVAAPALDSGGNIYVTSSYYPDWTFYDRADKEGEHAVYKISPGGNKIWRFLFAYVLHSTPVVDEARGVVYVGGHDKRLITLDMTTGEPRGCRETGTQISSSPALLPDGSLVYAGEDGYLYKCSPGCAELLWKVSVNSEMAGELAEASDATASAADLSLAPYFMSSPIVLGGGTSVFAVNFEGTIMSVDAATGNKLYRAEMSSGTERVAVAASPAVGRDGSIFVTDYEGFLHAFTGNGGCPMGHYLSFDPGIVSDLALPPQPPMAPRPPPLHRVYAPIFPIVEVNSPPVPSPPPSPPPPPPNPPPPPMAPAAISTEMCVACPEGTVAPDLNVNAACAYCKPGYYAAAPDLACDLCPSGSFRTQETSAPWDCTTCPFGQWQDQMGATYCLECSTAEWCLGGDRCKTGHRGLACSECEKGWFIFQGSCFPCQKNARYY